MQEVKNAYGNDWHKEFFGKVTTSPNGRELDSYWSEWSSMHPEVFDADMNPNDQVLAILDVYDEMKKLSEQYQRFNTTEDIRAMAIEIYNKFWNVPTVTTIADKYEAKIKKLKFEHRQAMDELKKSNQSQKLADSMHYGKDAARVKAKSQEQLKAQKEQYKAAIKKVREDKNRRFEEYRQYKNEQIAKHQG